MKLVIGLGNPGMQYEATRHNAGFQVVNLAAGELLAKGTIYGADFKSERKLQAEILKIKFQEEEVLLAKPTTYMNLSGRATQAILHWFRLPLAAMLVVHDDVSLPLGKIRFQSGGGAGGQHGVESIIADLGGKNSFSRLKVGVGPDPGGEKRAQFVLAQISGAEKEFFDRCMQFAAQSAIHWLSSNTSECMNRFNGISIAYADDQAKSAPQA